MQVVRRGLVIYEGRNAEELQRVLQAGDVLTNGHNRIVFTGTAENTEPTMHSFASKIQDWWRVVLARKHARLVIPHEYICPITLQLMNQPIIAADGNSYEYSAIQRFFRTKPPPCTGPKGIRIANASVYPNRMLISLIDDFKTAHRLAPMRHFECPLVNNLRFVSFSMFSMIYRHRFAL